jgi:hypothetical protein
MRWYDKTFNELIGLTKTASVSPVIGLDILTMAEAYLNQRHDNGLVPVYQEIVPKSEKVARLINLGFTNMPEVKEYLDKVELSKKEYNEKNEEYLKLKSISETAKKAFRLLVDVHKDFNDAIILPFGQFQHLCDKYNLKCGSFADYKGDVPDWAIDYIERLSKINNSYSKDWYYCLQTLSPVEKVHITSTLSDYEENKEVADIIYNFPFVFSHHKYTYGTRFTHPNIKGEYHNVNLELDINKNRTRFFICAPKHMMEDGVKILKSNKDPFICSYTNYGILIFARWGEEANDQLIQRMERINDMLNSVNKN